MHDISYRRHRFPGEIICHAVWLYYRFTLSYRDIEELLAERGIDVSYETVRRWCAKFGAAYAKRLRATRSRPSTTWHIDEVFVRIAGKQMYLWRLVDDEGEVLDVLLQTRRNKRAATRFLRRTLKKRGCAPAEIVSDKWHPTAASIQETVPSVDHLTGKWLNNRAENSHRRCHVNCLRHTSRRLVCPMRQAPTKLRAFERGTVSLTFWKSSVVGC